MPILDDSIESDYSVNIPDTTLFTVNDSLSSLHLQTNTSNLNDDINISENLTTNNNDSSTSIDFSKVTIANTLSFDDVTPIDYVMMTPTASSLDDFFYAENEEHKTNIKLYSDYDDMDIYEIGPIDRQDYDLILDSGCTHHMVCNSLLLKNIIYNDRIDSLNLGSVRLGNGTSTPITGYGDLWPFRKVLFVPGLQHNYISCRMLAHHGFSLYFIDDTATVTDWCR